MSTETEQAQHTRGPWKADAYGYVTADEGAMLVCEIRGWGRLTGTGGGLGLPAHEAVAIQAANARLIAAAPKLLAALERLLSLDNECDYVEGAPEVCPGIAENDSACHWCEGRAAIAAATAYPRGEES